MQQGSQSLKNSLIDNGVRDYIDEQISIEHTAMVAADTDHRNNQNLINSDIFSQISDLQSNVNSDLSATLSQIRLEIIQARQEAVIIGSILLIPPPFISSV